MPQKRLRTNLGVVFVITAPYSILDKLSRGQFSRENYSLGLRIPLGGRLGFGSEGLTEGSTADPLEISVFFGRPRFFFGFLALAFMQPLALK